MTNIIRRNNWRTLTDGEIEKLLPWLKIIHKQRMTTALLLLLPLVALSLAIIVEHIIDKQWIDFLKVIWIYALAGLLGFVAVYSIVDYVTRLNKFKKGDVEVVNVTVSGKGISSGYRRHYYSVRISGIYIDNKDVEKKFRVPKAVYDFVSPGDKAYAVIYNGKGNKDKLNVIDFLPSSDN